MIRMGRSRRRSNDGLATKFDQEEKRQASLGSWAAVTSHMGISGLGLGSSPFIGGLQFSV